MVGYIPTIDAPATEMATVYEILNQSNLMMVQLHLEQIVMVMDQALYAKATYIAWKHKSKYANIILRMGTFHTIMTLLADSLILWNQFLSYLRHDSGNSSTFWMSYVDMVGDILLGLIRDSREGNWELHLFAIRKMIPW